MSRYIDADALQNAMYHAAFETDTEMQRWDSGCWIRYKLFENILEQQPTADVVEVVHGEWIKMDKRGKNVQCSKCGNTLDLRGVNAGRGDANYCPNCGAKMSTQSNAFSTH